MRSSKFIQPSVAGKAPWLRLERFEFAPIDEQQAVIGLLAALPAGLRPPPGVQLVVQRGQSASAYPTCGSVTDWDRRRRRARGSELLWRVSFSVPVEVVEYPSALFALTALDRTDVRLPTPAGIPLSRLDGLDFRIPRQPVRAQRRRLTALGTALVVGTASIPAVGWAASTPITRVVSALTSSQVVAVATPASPPVATPASPPVATPASPPAVSSPSPAPPVAPTATPVPASIPARGSAPVVLAPVLAVPPANPRSAAVVRGWHDSVAVRVGPKCHEPNPTQAVPPRSASSRPDRCPRPDRLRPVRIKPGPTARQRVHQVSHKHHLSGGAGIAPAGGSSSRSGTPGVGLAPPGVVHPVAPISTAPLPTTPQASPGLGADLATAMGVSQLSGQFSNTDQPPPFLIPIYQRAGRRYHVPWTILAAINLIETDYGRNLSVSSSGAIGWMQFMPATWRKYGTDARGHDKPNAYDPHDAIFAAARYLHASGASRDLRRAIFAYNHAGWYVDMVLSNAQEIRKTTLAAWPLTSGRRARLLRDGLAAAPARAPAAVKEMIAAGNQIAGKPYLYGAAHGLPLGVIALSYDCSSSVEHLLYGAALLPVSYGAASSELESFGLPGPGRWVTLYASADHVFMYVAGLRWDTYDAAGAGDGSTGIGWHPGVRGAAGFVARHPAGM